VRRTGTPSTLGNQFCESPKDDPESLRGEADTASAWRVLIIGAETNREIVRTTMAQWALETTFCSSVHEARPLLTNSGFSLVFCEDQLSDGTYQDLLGPTVKPVKSRFVVLSPTPEADDKYEEAMRLGAFEMIASPCRKSDIQWIVIRAMQEESRRGGNRRRVTPHEDGNAETAAVVTNGAERNSSNGGQS